MSPPARLLRPFSTASSTAAWSSWRALPGGCHPRDELLRELEALGQHLVGDRDLRRLGVKRVPDDRCRLLVAERTDANRLDKARDARPLLDQALVRGRGGLADDPHSAGFDVWCERIQKAGRVGRVRSGVQRLMEGGEDPDDLLVTEGRHDLLDAALELADVHRSGIHRRRGRLERAPGIGELIEGGAHEGCLADPVLADEQDGTRWIRGHGLGDRVDDLAASCRDECGWIVVRPVPRCRVLGCRAERGRCRVAPLLECLAHGGGKLVVLEQDGDVVGERQRHVPTKEVHVDGLETFP